MRESKPGSDEAAEARSGSIIGVDLGGTKIRAVLADASGKFLTRTSRLTEATGGPDRVIDNIVKAVKKVTQKANYSQLVGLGLGCPGPLNSKTGVVYSPANLPGWNAVPLKDILQQKLGLPVFLNNDANLGALGEYTFGVGKDYRYLVYLTISTGIGGGVIEDGRMIEGVSGAAAELGHMTIEAYGPPCNCGNRGCLETLASGTAIRRITIERLNKGEQSLLNELANGNNENVTGELVELAARSGDLLARNVFRQAGEYLGIGITNILHLFNPEVVVIGGGVTRSGDFIFDAMRREVEKRAMPAMRENVPILLTKLGDEIGLYGAVATVLQNYEEAKNLKPLLSHPIR